MAEENFQERTERATPRRREKARERGQVAKSVELSSAVMVCLGVTLLFAIGPIIGGQMSSLMRDTFTSAPALATANHNFFSTFVKNLQAFMIVLAPVFAIMVAITFGVNVAQVGFKLSTKAIEPKLEKLNMISGMKRLFSMKSLVTMVRDSLKLVLIGFIAYQAISSEFNDFFSLPDMSVAALAAAMGQKALWIALKIGAAMLVLAAFDYAYQKYEFEKSIKMSRQEIKDEYKDTEGSPQIKSRVRQVQREMSRKRMMADVPKADVVITNPTHIAVALKYDPDTNDAPMVLAKGERRIAERIKQIALEHDIPIIEDKPLARALFKMCEIGQLVPQNLYRAVAEVLAYVYRLKGKKVNNS